mmetsp:Transcript_11207/g.25311  ORF Transcript_11207/g.25311 Transcript_11207/m.25311 type:complete len:522 (-) Transcript_11207:222-1787(-)
MANPLLITVLLLPMLAVILTTATPTCADSTTTNNNNNAPPPPPLVTLTRASFFVRADYAPYEAMELIVICRDDKGNDVMKSREVRLAKQGELYEHLGMPIGRWTAPSATLNCEAYDEDRDGVFSYFNLGRDAFGKAVVRKADFKVTGERTYDFKDDNNKVMTRLTLRCPGCAAPPSATAVDSSKKKIRFVSWAGARVTKGMLAELGAVPRGGGLPLRADDAPSYEKWTMGACPSATTLFVTADEAPNVAVTLYEHAEKNGKLLSIQPLTNATTMIPLRNDAVIRNALLFGDHADELGWWRRRASSLVVPAGVDAILYGKKGPVRYHGKDGVATYRRLDDTTHDDLQAVEVIKSTDRGNINGPDPDPIATEAATERAGIGCCIQSCFKTPGCVAFTLHISTGRCFLYADDQVETLQAAIAVNNKNDSGETTAASPPLFLEPLPGFASGMIWTEMPSQLQNARPSTTMPQSADDVKNATTPNLNECSLANGELVVVGACGNATGLGGEDVNRETQAFLGTASY